MKTLLLALFVAASLASVTARADLEASADDAAPLGNGTVAADGTLGAQDSDQSFEVAKQEVGPGHQYSNSDGVDWRDGVCYSGCHRRH